MTAAWQIVSGYLSQQYSTEECRSIQQELCAILGEPAKHAARQPYSYEETQALLSVLNEKESIRKKKGVYYTPPDVVRFILFHSVQMSCGNLTPASFGESENSAPLPRTFCYEKTVYDPTCGSGAFLLAALEQKLDLLYAHGNSPSAAELQILAATIHGNDLNPDSVAIAKLRLFLCILHRCGVSAITGLSAVLNRCFTCVDYVAHTPKAEPLYDIILGNPPYVETARTQAAPERFYGNMYANVLENAALQLKPNGVLGFVIPLSYVSTPRMKKIRETLYTAVPEQYILSYSDRPDCLFSAVHQKLCILFGKKRIGAREIHTGNYRYWYKEERSDLFRYTDIVQNRFVEDDFIPKLGTAADISIYQKIAALSTPIVHAMQGNSTPIYVNMRATFWIKTFLHEHAGAEYKTFTCVSNEHARLCMCLLNSSLFWWYWICVSDCWHITQKELRTFKIPEITDFREVTALATALEDQLERTKVYVNTKQTAYEYKHKACVDTIHQIDDCIHRMYHLTETEGAYIKNFAYRYRIGGGAHERH